MNRRNKLRLFVLLFFLLQGIILLFRLPQVRLQLVEIGDGWRFEFLSRDQ